MPLAVEVSGILPKQILKVPPSRRDEDPCSTRVEVLASPHSRLRVKYWTWMYLTRQNADSTPKRSIRKSLCFYSTGHMTNLFTVGAAVEARPPRMALVTAEIHHYTPIPSTLEAIRPVPAVSASTPCRRPISLFPNLPRRPHPLRILNTPSRSFGAKLCARTHICALLAVVNQIS